MHFLQVNPPFVPSAEMSQILNSVHPSVQRERVSSERFGDLHTPRRIPIKAFSWRLQRAFLPLKCWWAEKRGQSACSPHEVDLWSSSAQKLKGFPSLFVIRRVIFSRSSGEMYTIQALNGGLKAKHLAPGEKQHKKNWQLWVSKLLSKLSAVSVHSCLSLLECTVLSSFIPMGSARWVYPTCVSVGLLALLKVNLSYPTTVLCVQLTRAATDLYWKQIKLNSL